jgi:hypothetical protein
MGDFLFFIKIAQKLDSMSCFREADIIDVFIKESMDTNDIDWSDPNAYKIYLKQNKKEKKEEISHKPNKIALIRKILNEDWVGISSQELEELYKLGFGVERGKSHWKVSHPKLINSPKFPSGTITVNTHKKDKDRVDFNAAHQLKQALKYLGYI